MTKRGKFFNWRRLAKMNVNRRLVQERQQRRERKQLAKVAKKMSKEQGKRAKRTKEKNSDGAPIHLTIKENLLTKRNSTEELPEIKFKIKMKTPMGKVFDCYAKKYVRDAIFL